MDTLMSPTASITAEINKQAPEVRYDKNMAKMREASEEFETFFMSQMMEHMWADIDTDGPFGGGNAERVFRSMMIEEHSESLVNTGGIGIADAVMAQLLKVQQAGSTGAQ